jgi:hypothetical protein
VTAKDTGVFLTDSGDEISVRTIAHHSHTARTMVEPLYGTDAELMDGARGELRGKTGEPLRGTLRRQGNAFALHPDQAEQKVLEKTETTSPVASQPVRAKPTEETPETTPLAPPPPPLTPPPPRRARRKEKAPEAAPLAPPPVLRDQPNEQAQETAPSQAEAMEALKTLARFLGADLSKVLEKAETTSPVAYQPPPSQAEAIEAGRTVAQFLRDDGSVELELAKQAHAIVSEFIAERERQMTARGE